jgi:hypothetical protein
VDTVVAVHTTKEVVMRLPVKLRLKAAGTLTVLALGCFTQPAQADLKSDTDHPAYALELEPHLAIAPFDENQVGVGAGITGTFNVWNEGFINRLNDSVGISVGADWTGSGTYHLSSAMQWNFWLSDRFSVFGAPGVGVRFSDGNTDIWPAFGGGGRLHFGPNLALTVRAGFPVSAVGISLFF